MAKPPRHIKKGERFHNWLALEDSHYVTQNGHRRLVVKCECQCPKKTKRLVLACRLTTTNPRTVSRGCYCQVGNANRVRHPNPVLKGSKYGDWQVLRDSTLREFNGTVRRVAYCRCACGVRRDVLAQNLLNGSSTCCGCRTTEKPALKGEQFQNWLLLEDSYVGLFYGQLHGIARAQCQCRKKTARLMAISVLRSGRSRSCGCIPSRKHQPAKRGERFNMLRVIRYTRTDDGGNYWYLFRCDCGTKKEYPLSSVVSGNAKSCGCLHRELASRRATARVQAKSTPRWLYKGPNGRIIMRASWELAVAHHFDRNKVDWRYEPVWFTLQPGCRYLPDFYLPASDEWLEVKGYVTEAFLRKKDLFQQGHRLTVIDGSSIERFLGLSKWKIYETYKQYRISPKKPAPRQR
jgi:hypothetical protein